jgi:hypothetical protein
MDGLVVQSKLLINKITFILCFLALLPGCDLGTNTSSSEVKPVYKNTIIFENKTCLELSNELAIKEAEIQKIATLVDTTKRHQDYKLAIGWVFIPSYFFIDNNEHEAQKLSILKGEYDAILRSIKSKKCLN